ncbi:alpha/beta fold hydrolase [Nocardia mexicana]|uniref:3-oxoadipate enol-lactonase n=1 Tax=Nocardia mexicana TaxID=279262 RepID=A0A370HAU5_9NOCA|nr:alpha/beta hydrolase [Nocardia mexicana]RDI54053.1 3-oxoadipate enol-lactonase [Nocardia mexicana]
MRSILRKRNATVEARDGAELVCTIAGEGPSVLLVSGSNRAAAWHPVTVPALVEAGYQVVTYDHRGMPPSEVTDAPYTIGQLTDDMFAVVDALGLEPCHVVGTSMGGMIAQTAVVARPTAFLSATFIAGIGDVSQFGQAFMDTLVEVHSMEPVPPAMRRLLGLDLVRPVGDWEATERDYLSIADSMMGGPRPYDGRVGHAAACRDWAHRSHTAELERIRLPALVVAGQQDSLFPPDALRAAAASMPNAEFAEIPGGSHVAFVDMPAIADILIDFLHRTDNHLISAGVSQEADIAVAGR